MIRRIVVALATVLVGGQRSGVSGDGIFVPEKGMAAQDEFQIACNLATGQGMEQDLRSAARLFRQSSDTIARGLGGALGDQAHSLQQEQRQDQDQNQNQDQDQEQGTRADLEYCADWAQLQDGRSSCEDNPSFMCQHCSTACASSPACLSYPNTENKRKRPEPMRPALFESPHPRDPARQVVARESAHCSFLQPERLALEKLTRRDFMDRVVYGTKPVLLTHPALPNYAGNLDGLLDYMANNAASGFERVRSVTRPDQGKRPVKDFFKSVKENKEDENTFGFRMTHNATASFRRPAELFMDLPIVSDAGFFIVGSGRTEVSMHMDPQLNANLHLVLSGRKRFFLMTADDKRTQALHRKPLNHDSTLGPGLSHFQGFIPSTCELWHRVLKENQATGLKDTEVYSFWLEPGSVLFMPSGCWHHVHCTYSRPQHHPRRRAFYFYPPLSSSPPRDATCDLITCPVSYR